MVYAMTALAIVLYLVPVAGALVVRSRRDRPLWAIGLDVPLVVAIDMLSTLILARFVTLETAILASRPIWIAALVAGFVRARRAKSIAWPAALTPRAFAMALAVGVGSALLSVALSAKCHNADRAWHIPLTASLAGQTVPFSNVYEPGRPLAYHFTGDALAATFQILSLGTIHSSKALSIARDVCFGLTGATVAMLVLWLRFQRFLVLAAVAASTLVAGPMTVLRGDKHEGGYNFINFYKLSTRPHVPLAGLLIVAFAGVLMVHLRSAIEPKDSAPKRATLPVLFLCTGLLAITDEGSTGMLGLALGLTWLVFPEVAHPKRLMGIAVFAGLLAAVVLPHVLFPGSFAKGAPKHTVELIAWRSPGYLHPSLPLAEQEGQKMLLFDLFPMLGTLAGGLWAARRPGRARRGTIAFFALLVAISTIALCRIDVDKTAMESHRFMTAALVVFPILGCFWLEDFKLPSSLTEPIAPALIGAAMVVSSISSFEWMRAHVGGWCVQPSKYSSKEDFYKLDCRKDVGAGFGRKAAPLYISEDRTYVYAGCTSTFLAGPPPDKHWNVRIGLAAFGKKAMTELTSAMVPAEGPLRVICPALNAPTNDAVCKLARKYKVCKPLGSLVSECSLTAQQKQAAASN